MLTVRQTTERQQRGLAASGMYFGTQGCDSPESRAELLVEICKGTGMKQAWEVREGPSHATPEVVGKTCAERWHVRSHLGREVPQRALRCRWPRDLKHYVFPERWFSFVTVPFAQALPCGNAH